MSPTQGPNGEVNGFDVIAQVQQPPGSGSYISVAAQRGVSFAETTNPIDISSKERREGVSLPGRYGSTISFEHLYVPNASGYNAMKTAMRNGEYIRLMRRELGSNAEYADCVINNMSGSFPDQDAAVITADFTVSGAWTTAV